MKALIALFVGLALLPMAYAGDCVIEGDKIKVSARFWSETTDDGHRWMAQLDKPVCVWGVSAKGQKTYKVSDAIMLVRLQPLNKKTIRALETASSARTVLEGKMRTSRDKESRIQCFIEVSSATEGKTSSQVSQITSRGDVGQPWLMRASHTLASIMNDTSSLNLIARDALESLHPLNNFEGAVDWSVREEGKILILTMRVAWEGKILQQVYHTDIEWRSSESGHIIAKVTGDNAKIQASDGKKEALNIYFRTQIWTRLHQEMQYNI